MLSFIKYKRLVRIETDDEHVNNLVHMREELEYKGMFNWKFDDVVYTGDPLKFPLFFTPSKWFYLLGDNVTPCYSERKRRVYA